MNYSSVLVLRGGALGDFLLTLPMLGHLRRSFPGARIELIGNATAGRLGVQGGYLDAVYSQHQARWAGLYGNEALAPELADWMMRFDLVVNFWPDTDGDLAKRFPLRRGQTYLSAAAKPLCIPAARHYLEAVSGVVSGMVPVSFERDALQWRLLVERVPERGLVALHPGSSAPARNWPLDRWRQLGEILVSQGKRLLIIGGEQEAEAVRAMADLGRTALGLPLSELAHEIAKAELYLGHDTGVTHLAAAVGTPCVVLFGPSDPAMWAPPGRLVRVIKEGAGMDAILVERVLAELSG